ncbi:MAG: hypothetical protein ACK59Y_14615 [Betaproteobacteria bacterium]|jgi:hypothetical protein
MTTFSQRLAAALLMLAASGSVGAADPAKTLFGVELGSRFAIPACAAGEHTVTRRLCHNAAQTVKTAWGTTDYAVFFPRPDVVPYARGELNVEVLDGVIEAIHLNTWGIQTQQPAMDMLQGRYGPPTRSRSEKPKNVRSRIPVLHAAWDRGDFAVRYTGATTSIDWGRITLATPRYLKLTGDTAKP